jgi:predicted CXXCH cytochrome family protein
MKKALILFTIFVSAIFLTSCKNESDDYIDPRGTDYVGSESCIQCHQTQSESAFHSSHFKATSPANKENILGNFTKGNTFIYDKNTKLVMEKRNDTLYQVLYKNNKEVQVYPFEVLFGVKHAQTSAYWKNHYTYELPISYYKSLNSWATSPGYSASSINFERRVEKECYACHSSNIASRFITTSSDSINFMNMEVEDFMNKETIIYGIDCERCHGPAKKHVQTHLKFPELKLAKDIVSFKKLTKQHRIDACAICHSGNDQIKIKSRFQFKPGENLLDYFAGVPEAKESINYDVHGNQLGLLSQSKCFQKSETMDCMTCHNPHSNASTNLASYAKICMSCHQGVQHSPSTLKKTSKVSLDNNCVECHMPKQDSKAIRFQKSNTSKMSSYSLRTHKIAVYPPAKK